MNSINQPESSQIPSTWINSRVSLAEIESPNHASDLVNPGDTQQWRAFKNRLEPGDELWYFTSLPEFFAKGAGRMGYVILRNGKQVVYFNAMMN